MKCPVKSGVRNEETTKDSLIAQAQNGSVAYLARVRIMRDGSTYHDTKTFDRHPARSWIKMRDGERPTPGVIAECLRGAAN